MARVSVNLLMKPIAMHGLLSYGLLSYRRMARKWFIHRDPQIFKVDVNSGIRTLLTNFGQNFGGNWFDPGSAYALPVSPQPALLTTTWGEMKKE